MTLEFQSVRGDATGGALPLQAAAQIVAIVEAKATAAALTPDVWSALGQVSLERLGDFSNFNCCREPHFEATFNGVFDFNIFSQKRSTEGDHVRSPKQRRCS